MNSLCNQLFIVVGETHSTIVQIVNTTQTILIVNSEIHIIEGIIQKNPSSSVQILFMGSNIYSKNMLFPTHHLKQAARNYLRYDLKQFQIKTYKPTISEATNTQCFFGGIKLDKDWMRLLRYNTKNIKGIHLPFFDIDIIINEISKGINCNATQRLIMHTTSSGFLEFVFQERSITKYSIITHNIQHYIEQIAAAGDVDIYIIAQASILKHIQMPLNVSNFVKLTPYEMGLLLQSSITLSQESSAETLLASLISLKHSYKIAYQITSSFQSSLYDIYASTCTLLKRGGTATSAVLILFLASQILHITVLYTDNSALKQDNQILLEIVSNISSANNLNSTNEYEEKIIKAYKTLENLKQNPVEDIENVIVEDHSLCWNLMYSPHDTNSHIKMQLNEGIDPKIINKIQNNDKRWLTRKITDNKIEMQR